MKIRMAEEKDIPAIGKLLVQMVRSGLPGCIPGLSCV